MNPPRVFLPVRCKFDLTALAQFGRVTVVLRTMPFSIDRWELMARLMRKELAEQQLDPDRDYIALTGPMIAVTLLYGMVLSEFGTVRALLFDARTGSYVERISKKLLREWTA